LYIKFGGHKIKAPSGTHRSNLRPLTYNIKIYTIKIIIKMEYNKIQPPLLIKNINNSNSWDEWLSEIENELKEIGYRKYIQHHKSEDFCYWKTFKNGEDVIYQVGVLFYDFGKYIKQDFNANRIGIMYECMLLCGDRIDMCVSKNIDLIEFENMAKTFYESMSQYCNIK